MQRHVMSCRRTLLTPMSGNSFSIARDERKAKLVRNPARQPSCKLRASWPFRSKLCNQDLHRNPGPFTAVQVWGLGAPIHIQMSSILIDNAHYHTLWVLLISITLIAYSLPLIACAHTTPHVRGPRGRRELQQGPGPWGIAEGPGGVGSEGLFSTISY